MNFAITPILKLTECCNFQCEFCRYADNTIANLMELDTCQKIIMKVLARNQAHGFNFIELNFHGGEPMLWGKERFRKLLVFEESLLQQFPGLQIVNSIQTNGSLIDPEWLDIFRRGCFRIGLSIDGPNSLNGHIDRNGKDIIETGILSLLNAQKIPFGVLSVITQQHFGKARELYDFYVENQIHNVGLCYCFGPDVNLNSTELSSFLLEFYRLVFEGSYALNVRELDAYIRKIINGHAPYCMFCERKSCGHYLTFTGDEHVFFCDPEEKEYAFLGDLQKTSLEDILAGTLYVQQMARICAQFEATCKQCELLRLCGGGCSRTDVNGQNAFCETYKKIIPPLKAMVMACVEKYPKTFQSLSPQNHSEGEPL